MFSRNFEKLFNQLLSQNSFFGDMNKWERKEYQSPDGSFSFTYITNKVDEPNNVDELTLLKQKLDVAVEEQNFENAVELRDKIKNLEKNKEKISKLQKELDENIKTQNFEKAIELRDKINSLK